VLAAGRQDGSIKGPHVELANFLLFQIYVERRAYTEARGLLGSLPEHGERHDLIRDAIPVVLWKTGDEAKARALLTSLFDDASTDASALNNLASTLLDHEVALDLAVAAAARAIVVSGGSRHDIWDTYAEALFRSGDVAKAVEAEEKALARSTAQRDQAAYRAQLDRFRAALKKT
jgi:tetratricopeptide (TPR) repeat protein